MKYIVYDSKTGIVQHAFAIDDVNIQILYPGYQTQYVTTDDSTWQDVVNNPTLYRYENGELILSNSGNLQVSADKGEI